MAFSGRARRPGAFSANAKPAEALSDAPFVGEWIDEDGEVVRIKDSKIHASDGGIMQLTVKSKLEASFKMDGETYDGTLSSDGGKIIWSDGAAWKRKGASGAAEDEEEKRKQAEAARTAAEEAARKNAEEEETARAAMEAKKQAQELARKKAQEDDMARRTAALEKAKAAAAAKAAAEEAAKGSEPAEGGAAGPSMEEEKARIQAGIDKAKSAFEAEKARKAAALERAKAAKAQQEAAAAATAQAAAPAGDEPAKAQSQAGIDKARAAFEAEKARKAAALEKARAAKAAEAAAADGGDVKPVDEAKAKSQAGLDKARAAFEAEKARKAAALEKARAAKAAEQEAAAQAQPVQDEAKAKSEAGLNKARAAFEAEKARKAAALEKARAAKAAEEAAAKEPAEGGQSKDLAQAKAASTAGLNKAKAAFEAEKARKAAALEKARAAKAAEEAAKAAEEDEDDEPPSLTAATGAKRGSAFSAAAGKASAPAPAGRKPSAFSSALGQAQAEQAEAQTVDFRGPPKGKTMSAFSGAGVPQELQPPDPDSGPQVQVFSETAEPEIVGVSEADWEPGIVVKLQGLKSKPELNGQWGVLQEFNDAKKRWSVKPIDESLEEMALKADNLEVVSQEEYDKWVGDQANAEENTKYEMEAMLKSRVGMNKTRWSDSETGKVSQAPGENGNDFDVCMGSEPDGKRAASKIVDVMKEKGVCLVEANAMTEAVYQAYEEATALWNGGEFAPPMQDFGAGELEMSIWHHVLFQDDPKVKWIGEDAGDNMQALRHLSNNMRDFATGLATAAGVKLGIKWNNLWDGMLCCYTGDKSYAYHLDNPSMPDEHSLPDNGLRMTLAYFINTNWSPEDNYNGGGLEVYLTDPSGPPESLAQARKCNRIKIAPHADTLVVFPSQRMAHQVISTKGKGLYFCIWMWCFQEEVMEEFPRAVHRHWQRQNGEEVPSPRGSNQGEDDVEVEEIED